MATFNFPSAPIATVVWRLRSKTQAFISPLTGSRQVLELPGAVWMADIQFVPILDQATKRELSAFLVGLRGRSNKFYLSEPGNTEIAGSGAGTPVVDLGVSNTPAAIGVSGMAADAQGVFLAGDVLGFDNDEMKMVLEDLDANSSGEGVLKVEPPFRAQPSDLSTITTSNPKCLMSLVDDEQAQWSLSPGGVYTSGLSCIEVIV